MTGRPGAVSVVLLLAVLTVVPLAIGCDGSQIVHTPRYGLYHRELAPTTPEAQDYLNKGYELEEEQRWLEALQHFQNALISGFAFEQPVPEGVPERGRGSEPAFEARREIARCHFMLGEYRLAHEALRDLALYYRDYLGTDGQDQWPIIRDMWWSVLIGMFYKVPPTDADPIGQIADNHDDIVRALEDIIAEEPNGLTAAKAYVLIGRVFEAKGEHKKARDEFLRVVDNFQVYADQAEEALYRAAYATLASQKGVDYDPDVYTARGGESEERGARDLCDDYDRQHPGGRYRAEIARLRSHITAIEAYRMSTEAHAYRRLGYDTAAIWTFRRLVFTYGNAPEPEVQRYVTDARKQLEGMNMPLTPEDETEFYSEGGLQRYRELESQPAEE